MTRTALIAGAAALCLGFAAAAQDEAAEDAAAAADVAIEGAGAAEEAVVEAAAAEDVAAEVDLMANIVGNVATVTYADGSVVEWRFADDARWTNGAGQAGAWRIEGDQLCLQPDPTEGMAEEEACTQMDGMAHEIGDTWMLDDDDGSQFSVTLTASE